jgi:hypothetical protein
MASSVAGYNSTDIFPVGIPEGPHLCSPLQGLSKNLWQDFKVAVDATMSALKTRGRFEHLLQLQGTHGLNILLPALFDGNVYLEN